MQTASLERIRIQDNVRQGEGLDDNSLADLAASIRLYGVLQPVAVRKVGNDFELISGHRRYLAAQLAGLTELPIYVTELVEGERTARQVAENLHRTDLSLLDMAIAVQTLYQEHWDQAAVADMLNRSTPWVSKHLALAALPKDGRTLELLRQGHIRDLEIANGWAILERLETEGKHNVPDLAKLYTETVNGNVTRQRMRQALSQAKPKKLKPLQPPAQPVERELAASDDEATDSSSAKILPSPAELCGYLRRFRELLDDLAEVDGLTPAMRKMMAEASTNATNLLGRLDD